jgi:hypothetical protein
MPFLVGVVYWHLGMNEEAGELADKVVAIVPEHPLE